jgi:hypothetical protein
MLHGNTRYGILVDVIMKLRSSAVLRCVSVRQVPPTVHMNAARPRAERTPSNEDSITAAIERDPWRSSRHIAGGKGLSQPTAFEALHEDQLHSQHQQTADVRNILWTDEACYWRQGMFDAHKSPLPTARHGVSVWGIVVGPYLLLESLSIQ